MKKSQAHIRLIHFFLPACWLFGLIACNSSSDQAEIIPFGEDSENVLVESFGVVYYFSDSARLKAKLSAGHVIERLDTTGGREEVIHYLSSGVKIDFFDNFGRNSSQLLSDRGNFRREKRLAELEGNVILSNYKGEVLKTEQLFWDEGGDSVYTDLPVRIETPEEIINGSKGFRSNTAFSDPVVFGVDGVMEIEEEEL